MKPRHPEEAINMTMALEAFSPYLDTPRRSVVQVEALVGVAAILLFFQLIFGSCRRQSNNVFVHGVLWLAYTLSFPLITYTVGTMQSSPVKNNLYPIWAVFLFLIAGCTSSITAYDLEDNKQWMRHLFEALQYLFYVSMLIELLYPTRSDQLFDHIISAPTLPQPVALPCLLLSVATIFSNLLRIIAGWMVKCPDPSKVVADFMQDQVDSSNVQTFVPSTMMGYKYLVYWPRWSTWTGVHPTYYRNKTPENKVVTIEKIWQNCHTDLFNTDGGGSRVKDVCLSFALSQLLKRRFFGMVCAEARRQETRDFIFKSLLPDNNVTCTRRVFRIVEVELGFLYDFFTKYACTHEMESSFLYLFVFKFVALFYLGAVLLLHSPTLMTLTPVIQVGSRIADITITLVILVALLSAEILQCVLYMGSDWALVSLACNQFLKTNCCFCLIPSCLHKIIMLLGNLGIIGYWQNKIGQYSIVKQCCFGVKNPKDVNKDLFVDFIISIPLRSIQKLIILIRSRGKGLHYFVSLPDTVKTAIVTSLKGTRDGHLTNGRAALLRYHDYMEPYVLDQLLLTLENSSHMHTLLMWHIATDYCDIALSDEEKKQLQPYHQVATMLSRYCAYLVSAIPELLPGNFVDTTFVFNCVMAEARKKLGNTAPNKDILAKIAHKEHDRRVEATIFIRGLKLAIKLEGLELARRWQMLAEVWAEFIIYIAPSDNTQAHMERLAKGGEFLTHIWVLLTHAGILARDEAPTPGGSIA